MTDRLPFILAIDDTPANLLTLGKALGGEFDLQFATSGATGLALAMESPPDLILLDVMMPDMDGYETCHRLLADPATRDIPIIFITAQNSPVDETRGLEAGVVDFISKPVNPAVLRARVRTHLTIKRMADQLRLMALRAVEASRSKSQFLANMSHEIRTPMSAIVGMLTLLGKTSLTPKQADYVAKSENAAQSLLGLLNDILDISKAEAGKMVLDPQAVSLYQMVEDVQVIVSAYIGTRPVTLTLNLDKDLPDQVLCDELRLKQVLINLCCNAVKFTPLGQVDFSIKRISIIADCVTLKFSVQDNGIGIAPENQPRIFSGFTQAEASTTRRFGGTGLGLAISQHLIAVMGGKLELQSTLGRGSLFYFSLTLPIVAKDMLTTKSPAADTGASALSGMRILVVEDNFVNQQIASELLLGEGAVVQLANDGQEAIDLIDAAPFDVVLMDMQMPVMDGLTATRTLRQQHSASELPIVAMTANAMDSDRLACLDAGMNDYVVKPFNVIQLTKVLLRVTSRL